MVPEFWQHTAHLIGLCSFKGKPLNSCIAWLVWRTRRKAGWNFYANEFTLPPGEKSLCKEFVNLLMFRQPLDRLRSQISWIQKLYKVGGRCACGCKEVGRRAAHVAVSGMWDGWRAGGTRGHVVPGLGQCVFCDPGMHRLACSQPGVLTQSLTCLLPLSGQPQKMYEGVDIARAFKGRTSGFWERLVPAAVNNYYIRSLLGQRFFEYPIVAINSTHVQRAKIQVGGCVRWHVCVLWGTGGEARRPGAAERPASAFCPLYQFVSSHGFSG